MALLEHYNNLVRVRMSYVTSATCVVLITLALGGALQTFASAFNGMCHGWTTLIVVFVALPIVVGVFAYLADLCFLLILDSMNNPPLVRTRANIMICWGLTAGMADAVVVGLFEGVPIVYALVSSFSKPFADLEIIGSYLEGHMLLVALFCASNGHCQRCVRVKGIDDEFHMHIAKLRASKMMGGLARHDAEEALTLAAGMVSIREEVIEQRKVSNRVSEYKWTLTGMALLIMMVLVVLVKTNLVGFNFALPTVCICMVMLSSQVGTLSHRTLYLFLVAAFFVFTILLSAIASVGEQEVGDRGDFLVPPETSDHQFLQRYKQGMYPLCMMHWGHPDMEEQDRLTAVDLTAIAEAIYSKDKEEVEQKLARDFARTDLEDVKLEDIEENFNAIGRWGVVTFPKAKLKVFVIRGTLTTHDVLADVDMWCAVSVLQMMSRLVPLIHLLPHKTISDLLRNAVVNKWIGGPSVWTAVLDRARRLKEESMKDGYQVVVTGHSLGGGIAAIVGADTQLPTLAISPPGTWFSVGRFRVSEDALESAVTVIRPHHDAVPTVDVQIGFVQNIKCTANNPVSCHLLGQTVKTLYASCGDARGRSLPAGL
mmetsp:Transcript_56692/g.145917  ORF Transcript_56692/g.145917 Transcript_56692/m.145917 type:complete len:597 (-) Transcript_56692:69-1859(-)